MGLQWPAGRFFGRRFGAMRAQRRRIGRGRRFRRQWPCAVAAVRQSDGARQRFHRGRAGHLAWRRRGAHDIRFDDHVSRAADHHQMFHVVAPDEDQPPPGVDGGVVDHRKPRLSAAGAGAAESATAEAPNRPSGRADQTEHDQKRHEETHGERHSRTEQRFEHPPLLPVVSAAATGSPMVNSAGNLCRCEY